jgi:protease I
MEIACILAKDFEDSELRVPFDRLTAAGFKVVVIGARAQEVLAGKKGKVAIKTDRSIAEVRPSEFAALLIPGGYSPDQLRADDRFVELVRAFDDEGKLIAAVCHGPQLLLAAGLQRGRTLTAWPTVQVDLRHAGANVVDRAVVVDRNWITSRKPEDLDAFCDAILERLGKPSEARAIP